MTLRCGLAPLSNAVSSPSRSGRLVELVFESNARVRSAAIVRARLILWRLGFAGKPTRTVSCWKRASATTWPNSWLSTPRGTHLLLILQSRQSMVASQTGVPHLIPSWVTWLTPLLLFGVFCGRMMGSYWLACGCIHTHFFIIKCLHSIELSSSLKKDKMMRMKLASSSPAFSSLFSFFVCFFCFQFLPNSDSVISSLWKGLTNLTTLRRTKYNILSTCLWKNIVNIWDRLRMKISNVL